MKKGRITFANLAFKLCKTSFHVRNTFRLLEKEKFLNSFDLSPVCKEGLQH